MFGLSFAMMLFAVETQQLRLVAIGLGFVTFAASWRRANDPADMSVPPERRWQLELGGFLAAPGVLVLLCDACELIRMCFESRNCGPADFGSQILQCDWLLPVAQCVPYIQMVVATWLVWRHRARLWRTALVAGLTLWWAIGARMAAEMAISGNLL